MARLRRFYLQGDVLRNILYGLDWKPGDRLAVPVPINLPFDIKIHSVFAAPERRSVCVVVEHASFGEVAEGDEIPIGDPVEMRGKLYALVDDCALDLSRCHSVDELNKLIGACRERIYDLERRRP